MEIDKNNIKSAIPLTKKPQETPTLMTTSLFDRYELVAKLASSITGKSTEENNAIMHINSVFVKLLK